MQTACYRRRCIGLAAIAAWLLLGFFTGAWAAEPPVAKRSLLVFAAASTTDALEEIRAEFERQHADVKVRASFAASSTLARQIEAGAGADLFLSANREWADYLSKQKLVVRQRDLLGNTLVIVQPADAAWKLAEPKDLLDKRITRLALGDPDSVPAGIYARQSLTKLGLWEKLRGKVASGADVRQALQFVESGAAEAGIVYATDVAAAKQLRVAATIDPKLTEPIRYPLVLLAPGAKNEAALKFLDFLASDAAKDIFRRYGFQVLPPEPEKASQ